MPDENSKPQDNKSGQVFDVVVTMSIGQEGKEVQSQRIDFGKVREDQLKALTELFGTISSNVEAIRSLAPVFEKLDKSKPSYLR